MAPYPQNEIEQKMSTTAQNLMNLYIQTGQHTGAATETAMRNEIPALIANLRAMQADAQKQTRDGTGVKLPPEVVQYVENVRNPDIYTREFVEAVQKGNQKLKGREDAFASFRDILGKEIKGAIPEMRKDVDQILENTGGKPDE